MRAKDLTSVFALMTALLAGGCPPLDGSALLGRDPDGPTLTIEIVGEGSVDPASGSFEPGTEVVITATDCCGYVFDHWAGDLQGTVNPTTVLMKSDRSVTAVFVHALPDSAFRLLASADADVRGMQLVELQVGSPARSVPIGQNKHFFNAMDAGPDGIVCAVSSDELWRVDPLTGADLKVGEIQDESGSAVRLSGLTFHPDGTLYGVSAGTNLLYTIDSQTARATRVGPCDDSVWAIEFAPDGTLYGAFLGLSVLDPATGETLRTIGSVGGVPVWDLDLAPNGALYAVSYSGDSTSNSLYELDPDTGYLTAVADFPAPLASICSSTALDAEDVGDLDRSSRDEPTDTHGSWGSYTYSRFCTITYNSLGQPTYHCYEY